MKIFFLLFLSFFQGHKLSCKNLFNAQVLDNHCARDSQTGGNENARRF